eukprot:6175222-Pleurochrysis_carterae.AAC.1
MLIRALTCALQPCANAFIMKTMCTLLRPFARRHARVSVNSRAAQATTAAHRTVVHARTKLSMHAACKLRGHAGSDALVMGMRAWL